MSDWQTMDTAPRDGTRVLACRVGAHFVGGWPEIIRWTPKFAEIYGDTSAGWYSETDDKRVFPTHWQPLPAPPETER